MRKQTAMSRRRRTDILQRDYESAVSSMYYYFRFAACISALPLRSNLLVIRQYACNTPMLVPDHQEFLNFHPAQVHAARPRVPATYCT
jgi:hypothetical protein